MVTAANKDCKRFPEIKAPHTAEAKREIIKLPSLRGHGGQSAAEDCQGGGLVDGKLENAIEACNLKSAFSEGMEVTENQVPAGGEHRLPELEQFCQAGACNDIDVCEIEDDVTVGMLGSDVEDGLKLTIHLWLTLEFKDDNVAGKVFNFHGFPL